MCVCVCKQDLALNNLQGLICHKTEPINQPEIYKKYLGVAKDKTFIHSNSHAFKPSLSLVDKCHAKREPISF